MLARFHKTENTLSRLEPASHAQRLVKQWRDGICQSLADEVATEVPVAMVYNGISHAVMLATPGSLEQFGLGFSLAEGILSKPQDLYDLEIVHQKDGIELQMQIAQARFAALKQQRRNMAGRTGCGLCGAESLQQVVRHPLPVANNVSISVDALHAAFEVLPSLQQLQGLTGATHAAAWANSSGQVLHVEEDIGRHNALDKLIGSIALGKSFDDGFAIVTSRASYEMVQKSATVGIPLLAAISAPTGLAIELADEADITLVGFTRQHSHVVYTHPQRINPN